MSDEIKKNKGIETKNSESIPGEYELPDVKSKEYYENLVVERRMNSYEMKKNIEESDSNETTQELSSKDLDGVSGGKIEPIYARAYTGRKYGGPSIYRPRPKPLTPEEQKKLEEEKKKEREKKIEQILKLAREIDEDRSNR